MRNVTFYYARDCSLCDRAKDQLARMRDEVPFELTEVDITDVPELEARYREWLPVVEIDGERTFVYFIPEEQLRRKLARDA
jgi:glutaredoxin